MVNQAANESCNRFDAHHRRQTRTTILLLASVAVFIGALRPQSAEGQIARREAKGKFMGAATCASSNCHGSVSPKKSTKVLQNEYTTWYKHEAHSQAWNVLKNNDSKKIAALLGVGPAEKADLCLKCHVTYVPDAGKRGPKYRLNDGVSCESCHGAAEKYLQPHTAKDSSHAANVKLGMIDLVSLSMRARVCLECHHGTDDQTVDHRLIGAGHPRLTYEMDTYNLLQPNHWEVDDDYTKRKAAYNSARAWLVGQVERATEMSEMASSPKRSKRGAMPELALFYCYTCHHSLKEDQWKSRSYGGRPGELRLNVSSLAMVAVGLQVIDPGLAGEVKGKLDGLHEAYYSGSGQQAFTDIRNLLRSKVLPAVNSASFNQSVAQKLLSHLASYAKTAPSPAYELAEQCTMGLAALAAAADPGGKKYQSKIDALFNALKDEEAYNPAAFSSAVKAF